MPTFAELIRNYIERAGITDAELARSIGVRRQTIFRWKEGLVARPRHRDDVMSLAKRLRLTDEERDELLIVAGFAPESMPAVHPATGEAESTATSVTERDASAGESTETPLAAELAAERTETEDAPITVRLDAVEADAVETEIVESDVIEPESVERESVTRPAWLRFAPIAALLLVVVGIGYWLLSGESTQTLTQTLTQTPQPLPTTVSTAIPTITRIPAELACAEEGETLLLVALFKNYTNSEGYNLAGRIEAGLGEQISAARLTNARADILDRSIRNDADAIATLAECGAALLIWGEYDSGRVVVNLSTSTIEKTDETHLQTPDALAPIINTDVPNETRMLAMLALGEHFVAIDEADKAITVLENASDLNLPEAMMRNLYFQLGRAYSAVQPVQPEQAIDSYTKVLALSPGTVNAYYNRGLAYYTLFVQGGDPANLDLAISDYNNIIRRKPDYVNAYLNRGIAHYSRGSEGDLELALTDLNFVVEKQPDSYRGFYNRGLVGIALNRLDLWQADLQRAQELTEPESYDYVNTLVGLCWGYMLEKRLDDATANCQKAIDIAPERGDSRDSMGILHALKGDPDAALEQFELYIAWLSAYPEAYYNRYNGPLVEEWIEQLQAGEQPFTDEVLESLRNG